MYDTHLCGAQGWHMLTTDHTVLPAILTFNAQVEWAISFCVAYISDTCLYSPAAQCRCTLTGIHFPSLLG